MPGMNQVLGSAQTIFNRGTAWAPNTTSMVTPLSAQTKNALAGMTNAANGAAPAFASNFNRVNQTLGDGGLNALQNEQVNRLQGMAGGSGFNATQQQALDYLNPIASGAARQNNPYLDDVISRGAQDIGNSANLMASAAGRYGSDSHAGALGKQIGDFSSGLRYQDYGAQQARQDSAINQLFGMGTTGASQKNDAIGSLFNAGTQQRQNVLGGTQQLSDAYNAQLQPYQTLSGVGDRYEDLYSRTLQDKNRIFNEKKNAQTDPVNWLANLAAAFQGGQQVQRTSTTNTPSIMDLFGMFK
jgi:hypothetical protein